MAKTSRFAGMCAMVALFLPATLFGQYASEVVGFNGPPIDDPGTSQEMFRVPEWSGSTVSFITPNTTGQYDYNAAYRASGLQTEGAGAMQVFFNWVDPADPEAWVRLTTFDGPERPNPGLHLGGKVRFKITNRSELFAGQIGICIGIRETDVIVPQLEDAGSTGTIEWVGVTGVGGTPDHLRPIPAITIAPGPSPVSLEWDLATGIVYVNGSPQGGGIAAFTGDGVLSTPNMRGTLEHIAITNVASDTATLIDFAIDELQFESPVPDPVQPPTIRGPVVDSDTEVLVDCSADATTAELFINSVSAGTTAPAGGVATFSGLTLTVGDVLTATQTAFGETSDLSAPVVVYAAGTALAEDFDGYASQDDMEVLWSQTDPLTDRKLMLSSGSASSCDNLVVSDYPSGSAVSRLYFSLGSVNGTDAEPLLVTYRFKHDSDNTNARSRFELTSSLSRVYGALGFAFTNGVGGAFSDQYTTMTNSPDPVIDGYQTDYFGYDYALTGIMREAGVWHKMQIEVLSDVVNFYIDDVLANPVDPTSGLPIWPDGVPRVNNNDFQYIILGLGFANNGPAMMYDDISVTLGGTPVPFGDPNPVDSPNVDGPIFPGETSVDLSGIDPAATDVAVYADGVEVGSATGSFPSGTATVAVSALSNGQGIAGTQTVAGTESCLSFPEVVAVPAPTVEPTLVPGQTTVQVSDIEEGLATLVTVYRDLGEGVYESLGTLASPAGDPATVTTTALVNGDTIVATQTIGGIEGPVSAGVVVSIPAPTVVGPLDIGDTSVTVNDIHASAEAVTVYVNATPYQVDPAGASSVDVTVPSLQIGDSVYATQTIDSVEGPPSTTLIVGNFVVINQFSYDDSGTDDHEFVELYNAGDDPIDISNWVIQVGDYVTGQTPPGVYYQVFIPADTIIASHGFWTVGMSAVAAMPNAVVDLVDDGLPLGNGQNYLALRNANDVLLDAVAWETNKGHTFIPEEIYTQIGLGIWGNHNNWDNTNIQNYEGLPTAQSRFLDGLDTDENGRDWGILPSTPGYTNNQADLMPYFEDADSLAALDAVPNWVFSYKPVVAVDPGVVDAGGANGEPMNPTAIPASPDGGLAMVAWDETGGGNATYLMQLAKEDFTLETYIYVAPEFTPDGYEETKIGVRGSADGVHNFDYYSGATGVCWLLQRGSTWQTLYLLDENNGDDGAIGEPICATILATLDIGTDAAFTGWQRLLLEVNGDSVFGIFGGTYGSRSDGVQFTGTHDSPGPGGVYISYREAVADNLTARPPTLDALSLTEPPPSQIGDVDGDGDVDLNDLAALLAAYGSQTGDPNFNAAADFDGDGDVDLVDLATLLSHYGEGT